jgi:hypothetical protein
MYLLGYLPYSSSAVDRDNLLAERRETYNYLRNSWDQLISLHPHEIPEMENEKIRIGKRYTNPLL